MAGNAKQEVPNPSMKWFWISTGIVVSLSVLMVLRIMGVKLIDTTAIAVVAASVVAILYYAPFIRKAFIFLVFWMMAASGVVLIIAYVNDWGIGSGVFGMFSQKVALVLSPSGILPALTLVGLVTLSMFIKTGIPRDILLALATFIYSALWHAESLWLSGAVAIFLVMMNLWLMRKLIPIVTNPIKRIQTKRFSGVILGTILAGILVATVYLGEMMLPTIVLLRYQGNWAQFLAAASGVFMVGIVSYRRLMAILPQAWQ